MSYMKFTVTVGDKSVDLNSIIRIEDKAVIPFDESNKDYVKYLEWIDEGNSPVDFEDGVFDGS